MPARGLSAGLLTLLFLAGCDQAPRQEPAKAATPGTASRIAKQPRSDTTESEVGPVLQGTEAGTDKKGAGPDLPDFRTRAPEPLPADLAPGSLWLNQEETELAYLLEVPELSVSLFTLLRLPRGRRQTDFLVQAREDQTHARQILAYRKLKRVKPVMSSVLKFELKEEDTSRRLFLSGDGSPRKILILGTEFEVTAAHQPASSFRPLGYSRSGRFFFLRLVDGEEQTRSIVAAQVVAEPSGTNSPAASTAP